ncbi:MAG: GNAT family N-acetyltransferase, partial [Defluviitaleaceae bacterium]|nr:GNAT family N-acetyltransferase [Defluviitaleaceae bacterium]
MKDKALAFLERNKPHHIDMIFPIQRATADIMYAEDDGVLMQELESGIFMLSATCIDKGKQLLDQLGRKECYCLHQKELADYLYAKYDFEKLMSIFQGVYLSLDELKHEAAPRAKIKQLDASYIDAVCQIYTTIGEDYTKGRVAKGDVYGGFIDGNLCGIIGQHEEGGIGMLEILPEYRRQGLGIELSIFMTNLILKRGQTPFVQIKEENHASMHLCNKLGY